MAKAPAGDAVKPVPFNVSGLAVVSVLPFKSNTAPELTVVADDVPSAVVDPSSSGNVLYFVNIVPRTVAAGATLVYPVGSIAISMS